MIIYTKWKQKQLDKEQQKRDRHNRLKLAYQKSIDMAKQDMLNTPCAMRDDFQNCTDKCIHFQDGEIYQEHAVHELGVDTWLAHKLPKCKCWK